MALCGFTVVTENHCCRNRSEMWSNAKIQKLQILSVVFTTYLTVFYLVDQFNHCNFRQFQIFASILRFSFLQRLNLCIFVLFFLQKYP